MIFHTFPNRCYRGMTLGPRSEWAPQARYLFKKSHERYLKNPEHKSVDDAFKAGEFGVFEQFRFIMTS